MIRSLGSVAAVALIGLFGYYFFTDHSDRDNMAKAKEATRNAMDAVRDKGAASLVSVRLTATFGLDATRFLHVHYDNGHAVVYGLAPESLSSEAVVDLAKKVAGVTSAEAILEPLPESLRAASTESVAAGAGESEEPG